MSRGDLHDRHRHFREMQAQIDAVKDAPTAGAFDPGETLALFQRGPFERLRLARKVYQNRPYLDLRVEFRTASDPTWRPGRKGLSLKRREVHELAEALLDAHEADR